MKGQGTGNESSEDSLNSPDQAKTRVSPEKRSQVRFKMFAEQRVVVEAAIAKAMREHGVDRSRALEGICLGYMTGANRPD